MVYINQQDLLLVCSYYTEGENDVYRVKFINKLTKSEYVLEEFEVEYYRFACLIPIPEDFFNKLVVGEYIYELYDDKDSLITSGEVTVGDYKPSIKTYSKNQKNKSYNG